MNAKTLEAITRHGESLLRAFPNATEKNPVALCKKLRRIENSVAPIILRNCNEGVPEDELDAATDRALSRVRKLLGNITVNRVNGNTGDKSLVFINRDPRGYALKLDDTWTREYNRTQYALPREGRPIYADWGGYGILAPDLTEPHKKG